MIGRKRDGSLVIQELPFGFYEMELDYDEGREWNGRSHFFGAAAEAMRRILVEQARRKATLRRGGGRQREPLDQSAIGAPANDDELLEIHEVLDRLAAEDPVKAAVVKLRYFIGMTIPETAEVLGISRRNLIRKVAKYKLDQRKGRGLAQGT